MINIKAIIPVAGQGTRLRPHTHSNPKALLFVAGKPILGHILDKLLDIGVDEIILITGYLEDKIREYVNEEYKDVKFHFVFQEKRLGLGHAVYQAKDYIDGEPVIIIYGDTIFLCDLNEAINDKYDAVIGAKIVEDPRRFGVLEMEGDRIARLIEKPDYVKPMPAIVGVNYIKNTRLLFQSLKDIIDNDIKTKGEYQLTDGFQKMVENGAKMTKFPVHNWFDCGKPETLLETNRYLLELDPPQVHSAMTKGNIIKEPVFIGKGATIKDSIIGPFVSIAPGATIIGSHIENTVINKNSVIEDSKLTESLIGEEALVKDVQGKMNIGSHSEIYSLHK